MPRLLGWDDERIDARVEELLALVGLEPDELPQALTRRSFPAASGSAWASRALWPRIRR